MSGARAEGRWKGSLLIRCPHCDARRIAVKLRDYRGQPFVNVCLRCGTGYVSTAGFSLSLAEFHATWASRRAQLALERNGQMRLWG